MNNKPWGAPLGAFIDWRADMRVNGVARRPERQPASFNPPPSSAPPPRPASQGGPDRGFVEQPEERIPTRSIPTAAQQTLVRLPRDPRQTPLPIPQPAEFLPPAPEAAEMPKAKKSKLPKGAEFREKVVAWVLADGKPGAQARAAKKFDTTDGSVSVWMRAHKANGAPSSRVASQKTLVSSPESVPASGLVPAQLTVSIVGLEAHIRALVAVEVATQLKARLRGLME